jgi:hypothetical protein
MLMQKIYSNFTFHSIYHLKYVFFLFPFISENKELASINTVRLC